MAYNSVSAMRRSAAAAVLFATTILFACGESGQQSLPSAPEARPVRSATGQAAVTPGTCTDYSALSAMIRKLLGGGSTSARTAIAKLDNVERAIRAGSHAEAKTLTYELIDFLLDKTRHGRYQGTAADLDWLLNSLLCYAGIGEIEIEDPGNSSIVFPDDEPQVIKTEDQQAGVQLPANPVSEPTLITITPIDPDEFPVPGTGPLDTRLDQYPGYYRFHKQSETDAAFTEPVVVAVCAAPDVPSEVNDRLRLGHDASAGFEITPPAPAGFLSCPTETASSSSAFGAFAKQVASLFLPNDLHAAMAPRAGVGGLASEFSDFGPVDVALRGKAGVGGLASEFLRMEGSSLVDCSTAVEAPIGTPVPAECRPEVEISTALGTLLAGVPVSFTVEAGGGTVAPEVPSSCGTFGASATVATNVSGKARACWTLGASAGPNRVRATPSAGGDAPVGVVFAPLAFVFTATANPPVGVRFDEEPSAGSSFMGGAALTAIARIVAGTPFNVRASVVDKNGVVVLGTNGSATLQLNKGFFAGRGSIIQGAVRSGTVSFTGLRIDALGTGYFMTLRTFAGTPLTRVSNTFDIVGAP